MVSGIGNAPRYGRILPITGMPRLEGLTTVYIERGNENVAYRLCVVGVNERAVTRGTQKFPVAQTDVQRRAAPDR